MVSSEVYWHKIWKGVFGSFTGLHLSLGVTISLSLSWRFLSFWSLFTYWVKRNTRILMTTNLRFVFYPAPFEGWETSISK